MPESNFESCIEKEIAMISSNAWVAEKTNTNLIRQQDLAIYYKTFRRAASKNPKESAVVSQRAISQ